MKTIILVALITLGGFLFPSNDSTLHFRVAQYRADRQCAISYTFDDALEEHYTLVFPAFERLGFKGTFWVNGRTLSDTVFQGGKPRVTWAQLRRMSKKGHEISSHGWAHKNVTRLTPEELRYELQHNDTAIYNHIGVFPRTFCYPGNAKNDSVIAVVERTRIASRTEQFSVGGKSTDESLDKRVAELLANREWGVTMTHGITYGYDHFSDADVFWRHLRKVKAQDSLIWVAPFRTVAAYVKERKALAYEILPTKRGFEISLSIDLDKTLFTEPLTGVVELPGVKKITVRQNAKRLNTTILPNKVLFDFNPFGGKINIIIQ